MGIPIDEDAIEAAAKAILAARSFVILGMTETWDESGSSLYLDLIMCGKEVLRIDNQLLRPDGFSFPNLSTLPHVPDAAIVLNPPGVTEVVVDEIARIGIQRLWIQPGSESARAVEKAAHAGLSVTHSLLDMRIELRKAFPDLPRLPRGYNSARSPVSEQEMYYHGGKVGAVRARTRGDF